MSNKSAAMENNLPEEDRLTLDPVTGLRCEHLFRLRLPGEFSRARERETNAALLGIKPDKLIEINSRHGRRGGDEALQALSNLLQQIKAAPGNEAHLLSKLSGPVFGYFLPACPAAQAQAFAQDIVKQVFLSEMFIERITVSVGVVNFYEFFMREEDPGELAKLIERTALRRLATAEKSGGNTVCAVTENGGSAAGEKPAVLIVDPDQSAVDFLARSLESAGLAVKVCRNGEEAFTLIQTEPPAVIICEAMTPRMNGFMLRDRLQANVLLGVIPFILVSHKKTEEFIRKAVDLDIRHYFRKPFSVTELKGLVTNLVRRASA